MENAINWFSIPSHDFDRAVKFYETIFEISMEKMGEGDDKIASLKPMAFEGANGGISADPTFKPTSDGVRIYLDAKGQLDEVLGRVEAAGGTIIEPKTAIGEHGHYGLIEDTEGNSIGLHSM